VTLPAGLPLHVLREYAVLADGERAALVGPRGEIAWLCAPQWHDDPVFASLIGGHGTYAVTPLEERYVWGGYYEPGTLVWRGRWTAADRVMECRQTLAFHGDRDRLVLLHRIEAQRGDARFAALLSVGAGFGSDPMTDVHRSGEVWTARAGEHLARWAGAGDARWVRSENRLELVVELREGDRRDLVLEVSRGPLPERPPDPGALWLSTDSSWTDAVPSFDQTLTPTDARQSYAVLRGLTSASGGMVAAATMSLPEHGGRSRNYDYRYAWIRDQCYAGQAVAACGPHPLLASAVRFVSGALLEHGEDLRPAYTVDGGRVPDERQLDLPGYPGGKDVVGNWVNEQFQLDTLGEALLLFAAAERHGMLDLEGWRAVETCIGVLQKRWRRPDAGIWELENQRWAHSRLICAAGLRAVAALAPRAQGAGWAALADTIVADTTRDCLHPTGRWQQSPDLERVDAALLLAAIRGAVSPDDPRSTETLEAVRRDLSDDGYLYRFRHDDRPLGEAEGVFLLCGFHMALALHQQGRHAEALRWFERGRAACTTPGLFTEEFDVRQRQLRGNLPQAFVHAGLLEASARLADGPGSCPHT
jgi:hypothetical protein